MSDPSAQTPVPDAATDFAGWLLRVAAVIIDAMPATILFVVLTLLIGDSEVTDSGTQFALKGWPFVVFLLIVLPWWVYNWGILQGRTGQTVGKRAAGIRVVGLDGQPVGVGMSLLRQVVHVIDSIPCLLGWLWPLWDGEKRTFTDMVMSTRVRRVGS